MLANQPNSENTGYWILSGIALLISALNWLPKLVDSWANARKYRFESIKKELEILKIKAERQERAQLMIDAILIHAKPFIIRDIKDPEVIALFERLEQINNDINANPETD